MPYNGLVYGEIQLFLRQIGAIAITILIAVAGTLIAAGIASAITKGMKVSGRAEMTGLDTSEHGETAYPAFNGMD